MMGFIVEATGSIPWRQAWREFTHPDVAEADLERFAAVELQRDLIAG